MAKRDKKSKRKKPLDEETPREFPVSVEALRGVSAVLAVAIALFLALAAFNIGGSVGAFLFEQLSKLLGIGYMLLPLSLLLLAIALMRSFQNRFGFIEIASMLVFLLSSLGFVAILFPERGGIVGSLIASPLVVAVDTAAAIIFLLSFIVATLIISFDINLGALFTRLRDMMRPGDEEVTGDEVTIGGLPSDEDEEVEAEEDAEPIDEEVEAPVPEPKYAQNEAKAEGEFPIIAASASVYSPPPLSILGKNKGKPEVGDVKANMNILQRTLQNFGIQVQMDEVSIGPTVTRYAMKPAEGVRLSKIVALQSNLELALAASPVRIEAPIPGKALVGIEVPNIARTTLGLAPLFSENEFTQSGKPLLIGLGRSITGAGQFADLARMPHTLIAGTTGSGKSVMIHSVITSLLYRSGPERLRFIMVDPKRVELTLYNSIPHLLTPVITDAKKAILALKWLAKEMDRRYTVLETERVRDIASYHENIVKPAIERGEQEGKPMPEAMPYIVLIIDELADIMQTYPRELEAGIVRLAQMSRAVGIHLILSTQRPSVKVITGLIKANIPARIAFQVASQIDSRTILDQGGAEKLLGAGDMLFLSNDMSKPRRIQAPFISEGEVKKVVSYVAKNNDAPLSGVDFSENSGHQAGGPSAIFSAMEEDVDDDKYAEAKAAVLEAGKASTSYLQRKLGIGYSRAARLIDILEEKGVIGPGDGAKPREVIGAGNADELAQEPQGEEEEEFRA
ncbi:MAG: DNA translocase FtsK 4TM domain-containing protein [Minisyncoccia bacterium]